MQVSIVLSLVDYHSQLLGNNVVYPLNAPVTGGMIGACSTFVHAQQLIYSLRKLGVELQPVVREYGARAPPQGDVLVQQGILDLPSTVNSAAVAGIMSARHLAIGEKQNVDVASWCDRKGAKVVNIDGDT